jgi:DNA polymerase-4
MGSPVPDSSSPTNAMAAHEGRKIIHVDMDAFYASGPWVFLGSADFCRF